MAKIILIAGPSGAGKTTISKYLTKKYGIARVVTHTTRPRRTGEVSNQSYYFESPVSFEKLHFLERVVYGQYQYGSSLEGLKKSWQQSEIVSLIVDIKGAQVYLRKLGQQVYFLYVTAVNKEELAKRLRLRGDQPERISQRLSGDELNVLPESLKKYAHVLVNDDWQKTKEQLDRLAYKLKAE